MTATYTLSLNQNNDEEVQLTFTEADAPYDLTGIEVDFFIKTSSATADTDPSTLKLSTATGDITVATPTNGVATLTVAATDLATAGVFWWRCDVVVGTTRKTAGKGTLNVEAM